MLQVTEAVLRAQTRARHRLGWDEIAWAGCHWRIPVPARGCVSLQGSGEASLV